MQQGIVLVQKKSKGLVGIIKLQNGKELFIQGFAITEDINNCTCEFACEDDQLVRLIVAGKEIIRTIKNDCVTSKSSIQNGGQRSFAMNIDATAPYNFVRLPAKTALAQFKGVDDFPAGDRYYPGRHTGYISLDVETRTPLYIKGEKSEFFAPGGVPQIPGSSMRGMVRTLVEIASCSRFVAGEQCEDKRLYNRAMMDRACPDLAKRYQSRMVDSTNYYFPKTQAGLLSKVGTGYQLAPSEVLPTTGTAIYKVEETVLQNARFPVTPFQAPIAIYFIPAKVALHSHRQGAIQLKYAKVVQVTQDAKIVAKDPNYMEGYLVVSGSIPRKHMHWIISQPAKNTPSKLVPDDVIEEYRGDASRKGETDLLKRVDNGGPTPCFYLEEAGNITAIGHTGMFRLPYANRVGDCIPKYGKEMDLATAIFGQVSSFAGRVFFEDSVLKSAQEGDFEQQVSPKILSGPKPTTFQHYLQQNNPSVLNHWDTAGSQISGYKLYWHRQTPTVHNSDYSWSEGRVFPPSDTQHIKIQAMKAHKVLKGRIRFENLSTVELGVLLFVLDLPDECCHKIGMGKPLGLGSIKIRIKLHCDDRKKRYGKLFTASGAGFAVDQTKMNIKLAKKAFALSMCKQTQLQPGADAVASYWKSQRMNELMTMLTWKGTDSSAWLKLTNYKALPAFRERQRLPDPQSIGRLGKD